MTKKHSKHPEKNISKKRTDRSVFPMPSFRIQWIIIVLTGIVFYINTLSNEYALDDKYVILMNPSITKGLSGIPHILVSDIYESLIKQTTDSNLLSGGRYRPLSIVTFALDQQFFGGTTTARHLINVLLYALSLFVLLQLFSKYFFPENALLAFLSVLLFAIHPIHTEVVANIKSRDEILSLLFITLTFISVFRYAEGKKTSSLVSGLIYFFLALLAKEYAVTLLLLIPVSLYLFRNEKIKSSVTAVVPYLGVFILYVVIRVWAVGFNQSQSTELLNNPYILATTTEKWATKIYVLLLELKLLLLPYPLSADYGYNTIPYRNFTDTGVWLAIIIYTGMAAATVYLLKKRNPMAFALLFFLSFLFLVSNFVMDIGATMGERLLYHSSLGITMMIASLILFLIGKIQSVQNRKTVFLTVTGLLVVLCFTETYSRNQDWKNDATLWIHDVKVVPNSALANNNAGTNLLEISKNETDLQKRKVNIDLAMKYINHAMELNPNWLYPYLNLANAYMVYPDLEKAEAQLRLTRKKFPANPLDKNYFSVLANKYVTKGNEAGKTGKFDEAIANMEKAMTIDSTDANVWYSAGGAYFITKQYDKAKRCWEKTLQLNPALTDAQNGLNELKKMGF